MKLRFLTLLVGLAVAGSVVAGAAGCASETVASGQTTAHEAIGTDSGVAADGGAATQSGDSTQLDETTADGASSGAAATSVLSSSDGSILDVTPTFTNRDLDQSPDLDDATYISLASGIDILIDVEGVHVLSGDADNATVVVDAGDEAKVQPVLDGVSIVNDSSPAVSVISADKVFLTLTDSANHLEVSGAYADAALDAVIFSRSDLVLNGTGSLAVVSKDGNGITSKDDLKITGGTYSIESAADGLEANDSIRIYDGDIDVVASKDALHSENADDASLNYIYMTMWALGN